MTRQYGQVLVGAKPFVKWAGGKRRLLHVLDANLPESFGAYHEPFLGGGALLFHVLAKGDGHRCHASDLNRDLVSAYHTIRDSVDELVSSLRDRESRYQKDPKRYYYSVRASRPGNAVERASRLLFLNRTCFNGLYRVNSKGMFNVPLGRYSRPNIVNEGALRAASQALRSGGASITCGDFASAAGRAGRGDLVYLDPPYQPVSETANFTSYTDRDFDDLDRLFGLCEELHSRGCMVMLSNSDSGEVSGLFSGGPWDVRRIPVSRSINSDAKKRSGHHELLIKNY